MRGYCARCQEYRSDVSEDAWSIVWKQGNPTCERCGSFVDVNYFVELKNANRKREVYPSNGRPSKLPEITRKNTDSRDCCESILLSGISFEREKKEEKEVERRIERSGGSRAEKESDWLSCFLSLETYRVS